MLGRAEETKVQGSSVGSRTRAYHFAESICFNRLNTIMCLVHHSDVCFHHHRLRQYESSAHFFNDDGSLLSFDVDSTQSLPRDDRDVDFAAF